jgi:hypothetical protein
MFSRDDDAPKPNGSRISWLDSFADRYKSIAQENKISNKSSQSYFDEINSIMNNDFSTKHGTVESKVNEYRKLTGLTEYLNKIQANEASDKVKNASEEVAKERVPEEQLLTNVDQELKEKVLTFIKNKCKTTEGRLPVPAILDEVLSVFSSDGLPPDVVGSEDLIKFISFCNDERKRDVPNNFAHLGLDDGSKMEDDGSNSDFFHNFNNIR